MNGVIETIGTMEDLEHLRLHQPLRTLPAGPMKVTLTLAEESESPYVVYPDGYHKKTPAERAKSFRAWAQSHQEGPGLSDWAVSRDSIYD